MPHTRLISVGCGLRTSFLLLVIACGACVEAQIATPSSVQVAQPEAPQDTLGRTTPRGAVLGFLTAAAKKDNDTAVRYLNTRLTGEPAAELARQLLVVLNRRLPANLNQLSNRPEGSQADPLHPNLELIGTIPSEDGNVDVVLERLDRGKAEPIWLFSRATLDRIPDLYEEVDTVPVENILPEFLTRTRIANIPLFEWFAIFLGLPFLYWLTGLLNRLLSHAVGELRRRLTAQSDAGDPQILPRPIRLLVLVVIIRWMLSHLNLPLLQRQFWSSATTVITIAAFVWLFIILDGKIESLIRYRLTRNNKMGGGAVLRLGRRMVDILAVFIGVFAVLYHFGLNPTGVLAGLGVGGIAVALAAQKTLENLIGGISVIFDHVMRVGDRVTIGTADGTVEDIGLRSTRIRTLGRTIISVPNGQIANASLDNLSRRDKFWFHQNLSLHKETSGSQMRSLVEQLTNLLHLHSLVERDSCRVSFLSLSASSLDVEMFAYFFAKDWNHFLEIQGELLLQIMEILQSLGVQMAIQSRDVRVNPQTEKENLPAAAANPASNSLSPPATSESKKRK